MDVRARAERGLTRLLAATACLLAACKNPAPPVETHRGVAVADPAHAPAAARTAPDALSIHTADNWTLTGEFRPGDATTAVLLVHQLASNHTEWGPLISRLQPPRGVRFPTLAIDLRGHGGSMQGPAGPTTWQSFGTDTERWGGIVEDVAAAVRYLRGRTPAPTGIVLVGSSIGSSAALRYAAEDPRITGVVLLSPGLDYRGIETRDPMARYASTGRPALLIASDGDTGSAEAVPALLQRAHEDLAVVSTVYTSTGAHGVSIAATGVHPELWQRIEGWIRGLSANDAGGGAAMPRDH